MLLQIVLLSAFPALMILAALRDAVSYTIPNGLSLGLVAVFPLAALACGLPLSAIGLQAGVGLAVLALGMGMFAMGWMGGGDVKLAAAAALWLGWPAVMELLLVTALVGGALTFLLLFLRSAGVRPFVPTGPAWLARLISPGESVPYGLAITAGALAAFPHGPLMAALLHP